MSLVFREPLLELAHQSLADLKRVSENVWNALLSVELRDKVLTDLRAEVRIIERSKQESFGVILIYLLSESFQQVGCGLFKQSNIHYLRFESSLAILDLQRFLSLLEKLIVSNFDAELEEGLENVVVLLLVPQLGSQTRLNELIAFNEGSTIEI